ncbi:MAG: hypothetical protein Q4D02_07655 [Clostridia bacterium]|nr:hypothetical protein [Clostridia bacterium]
MKRKKIITIVFLLIVALGIGVIAYASNHSVVTEDKALEILLQNDLGLNESIYDFSILGSDYNGTVEINGEECYLFSFMEKGESGHIAYNFAVSMDGKDIYRYDVVNDVYEKYPK